MRAVCYNRVSTAPQIKNGSIKEQKELAIKLCEQREWVYIRDYNDVESGEEFEKRGGLQELIKDANKKPRPFDVVIIYDPDRLARDVEIAAHVYKVFDRNRIQTYFITLPNQIVEPHNFKPSEDDSLLANRILSYFKGTLDQQTRVRRSKAGKLRKLEQGIYVGSTPPYGYKFKYDESGVDERTLVPDENEYPYVIEAINARLQGWSLNKLTRHLDAIGAPTRDDRVWDKSTVQNIINNSFYFGKVCYNKTVNINKKSYRNKREDFKYRPHNYEHPFTWEHYLQLLDYLENIPNRIKTTRSPLAGIIKCGYCGKQMSLNPRYTRGKKYEYFACNGYRASIKECENPNTVRADDLIEAVKDGLNVYINNTGEKLKRLFAQNDDSANLKTELNLKKRELETIKNRLANLDQAMMNGDIPSPKYKELYSKEEEKQIIKQDEIEKLEARISKYYNIQHIVTKKEETIKEWAGTKEDFDKPFEEWDIDISLRFRNIVKAFYPSIHVFSDSIQGNRQRKALKIDYSIF